MKTPSVRILILGASGMLGHTALRYFAQQSGFEVFGSLRAPKPALQKLAPSARLIAGVDVENSDALAALMAQVRPHVVLNAIGVVKQLAAADDPLVALPINALLPHRLARLCELVGARLVHVSTDCVFTGKAGLYKESDAPDALDLYGRSKLLGEVDYPHAVTLRTSIIGPELGGGAQGLVGWFLAQQGMVKGFNKAVFSGLPTLELARVIHHHVLPRPELHGTWHVSSAPIDKYALLQLVKAAWYRDTLINPEGQLVIDRSLDSSRFREATGYQPAAWPLLVQAMKDFTE
ncbi:MAG: dTDP-4-dehydrorhamnose reductase family protein [Burkholderiales bacterium]|jgi:dTDP-4-dehydrorhamnose reductase